MSSYYISDNDYDIIRNRLLNNDLTIVKSAVQDLIIGIEENKILSKYCCEDLCAILYNLVQCNDYKIRKWCYHLIVYKHTPNLIKRCIKNLTDGIEQDSENITWILALASMCTTEADLYTLYKNYARNKITLLQYRMCTSVFSTYNIYINRKDVRNILNSEDFLSKMWLTKIYACIYPSDRKKKYKKIVDHKTMNELLDANNLNRYALWAFSTFTDVDVKKIKIAYYKANSLDSKSQAWYFNCVFKDKNFLVKNRDYIEDILDGFLSFPVVVQKGIIRGIKSIDYKLDYLERKLVEIYQELDENNIDGISLSIELTEIFLKHYKESAELIRLLNDIKKNTNISIIKHILRFFNNKEGSYMSKNFTFNGPVQYTENATSVLQNNIIVDSTLGEIPNAIKTIEENLKDGKYDGIFYDKDIELKNMITNVQYDLEHIKKSIQNDHKVVENIKILLDFTEELRNNRGDQRKITFSNVITKLAELCTLITAAPQVNIILQNIITHINQFLCS